MAIEPIGGAARNFLRMVLDASEAVRPADDELVLAIICIHAGYLTRVSKGGAVEITGDGRAYLDQLARCE